MFAQPKYSRLFTNKGIYFGLPSFLKIVMIIWGVIREPLQVNYLSQAVVYNFSVAWLGSLTLSSMLCLEQICRFDLSVVLNMKLLFFRSFEVHSFKPLENKMK